MINMLLTIARALVTLVASKKSAPEATSPTTIPPVEEKGEFWSLDAPIMGTQFTWRQALAQGNTGTYAIPTVEQENMIIKQAKLLEGIVRVIGPIRVTSWLRTPEHNRDVGGAQHSVHLVGAATDFIPLKVSVEEAKKMIRDTKCYPGGTELNSTTWCHYDYIHTRDFFA